MFPYRQCSRRLRQSCALFPLTIVSVFVIYGYLRYSWFAVQSEREIRTFLRKYDQMCQNKIVQTDIKQSLCPCLPEELGPKFLDPDGKSRSLLYDVTGGGWEPKQCQPRHRVAIIIPYRNREDHLRILVSHLHPFLQQQLIAYQIFVIEQAGPVIFNRASLMNVGFNESWTRAAFDCYIFHDVDLLPEDTRNMYTCTLAPVHLGAYMNKFGYKMPYPTFFGGAVALTGEQLISMNGFSNNYFGWGGEDDDTYNRVLDRNLTVYRYPQIIGRSFMIKHESDKGNPRSAKRDIAYNVSLHSFYEDGLNNLKYKIVENAEKRLYTLIKVKLEKTLKEECIIDNQIPATVDSNYVDCLDEEDNFKTGLLDCCRDNGKVFCCRKFPLPWGDLTFWQKLRTPKMFIPILVFVLVVAVAAREKNWIIGKIKYFYTIINQL